MSTTHVLPITARREVIIQGASCRTSITTKWKPLTCGAGCRMRRRRAAVPRRPPPLAHRAAHASRTWAWCCCEPARCSGNGSQCCGRPFPSGRDLPSAWILAEARQAIGRRGSPRGEPPASSHTNVVTKGPYVPENVNAIQPGALGVPVREVEPPTRLRRCHPTRNPSQPPVAATLSRRCSHIDTPPVSRLAEARGRRACNEGHNLTARQAAGSAP